MKFSILLISILLTFVSCGKSIPQNNLTVFSAAAMTPVLEEIKKNTPNNLNLILEFSGSQVACRKIAEFGRQADLIISADKNLFNLILKNHVSFRLDFACDEIVLGVGHFAKFADKAEKDPFLIILKEDVKLARVDEKLAPIGYMSLFSCMLAEKLNKEEYSGLTDAFKKKSIYVTDDIMQLIPYLKMGQIDYTFIFKSACIANDIRFISLPESCNLSNLEADYSSVELIDIPKKGLSIKGSPALFSLSIPDDSEKKAEAVRIIKSLCSTEIIKEKGFIPLTPPRFFGDISIYRKYFADFAKYEGEYF